MSFVPEGVDIATGPPALSPAREKELIAEFKARLNYIIASFKISRALSGSRRTYNESVKDLRRARRPRAKRAARQRLDVGIETLVNVRLRERSGSEPTSADVVATCRQLADELKSVRGRPPDSVLAYHLKGIMLLIEETCGVSVTGAQTTDSVYEPRLSGRMGLFIQQFFADLDPSITPTTLANIIRTTGGLSALDGKSFASMFPLYGCRVDTTTGLPTMPPGMRLERFDLNRPIYCS